MSMSAISLRIGLRVGDVGNRPANLGEQFFHRLIDAPVGLKSVADKDEGDVHRSFSKSRCQLPVEPVGLPDFASHGNAVDGMLHAFLGNGDEKPCAPVARHVDMPHSA